MKQVLIFSSSDTLINSEWYLSPACPLQYITDKHISFSVPTRTGFLLRKPGKCGGVCYMYLMLVWLQTHQPVSWRKSRIEKTKNKNRKSHTRENNNVRAARDLTTLHKRHTSAPQYTKRCAKVQTRLWEIHTAGEAQRLHQSVCIIDNIAPQRAMFIRRPTILKAAIGVVCTELNADAGVCLTALENIWNLSPRIRSQFSISSRNSCLPARTLKQQRPNLCRTLALAYSWAFFHHSLCWSSLCDTTIHPFFPSFFLLRSSL